MYHSSHKKSLIATAEVSPKRHYKIYLMKYLKVTQGKRQNKINSPNVPQISTTTHYLQAICFFHLFCYRQLNLQYLGYQKDCQTRAGQDFKTQVLLLVVFSFLFFFKEATHLYAHPTSDDIYWVHSKSPPIFLRNISQSSESLNYSQSH